LSDPPISFASDLVFFPILLVFPNYWLPHAFSCFLFLDLRPPLCPVEGFLRGPVWLDDSLLPSCMSLIRHGCFPPSFQFLRRKGYKRDYCIPLPLLAFRIPSAFTSPVAFPSDSLTLTRKFVLVSGLPLARSLFYPTFNPLHITPKCTKVFLFPSFPSPPQPRGVG